MNERIRLAKKWLKSLMAMTTADVPMIPRLGGGGGSEGNKKGDRKSKRKVYKRRKHRKKKVNKNSG